MSLFFVKIWLFGKGGESLSVLVGRVFLASAFASKSGKKKQMVLNFSDAKLKISFFRSDFCACVACQLFFSFLV